MIQYVIIAALLVFASLFGMATQAIAITYSSGTYGTCTYDTCSISLSSSSTVSVNVTPTGASTLCTIQNDSVTATTDASTGYTVTINDGDTSTTLNGPSSNTIPAISATAASPAALTANTWGYRIDGIAGFGAGPTSSLSNGSIPAYTFAAPPISSSGGALVRTTSTADSGTVATSVWYGTCANATKQAGTYSNSILYTATVN